MTSAILEFLILGRVAGFGVVVYGLWRVVRPASNCKGILSFDKSTDNAIGDL